MANRATDLVRIAGRNTRSPALILEPARTNLITNNQPTSVAAPWSGYATGTGAGTTTFETDPVLGPVVRIKKTGGAAGDRYGIQCSLSGASGDRGIPSCFVKPLDTVGTSGIDLTLAKAAGSVTSAVTVAHNGSGHIGDFKRYVGSAPAGAAALTGTGTLLLYVTGATGEAIFALPQVEAGTGGTFDYASTPILTTAGAATRAQDYADLDPESIMGLGEKGVSWTMSLAFYAFMLDTGGSQFLFEANNGGIGTSNTRISMFSYRNAVSGCGILYQNGIISSHSLTVPVPGTAALRTWHRLVATFDHLTGVLSLYRNGALVTSATLTSFAHQPVTQGRFGGIPGSAGLYSPQGLVCPGAQGLGIPFLELGKVRPASEIASLDALWAAELARVRIPG